MGTTISKEREPLLFHVHSPGLLVANDDDEERFTDTTCEVYLYLNTKTRLLQVHTAMDEQHGLLLMRALGNNLDEANQIMYDFIQSVNSTTHKYPTFHLVESLIIHPRPPSFEKTEKTYPVGYIHLLIKEDNSSELSVQSDTHPTIYIPYVDDRAQIVQAYGTCYSQVHSALEQLAAILAHS